MSFPLNEDYLIDSQDYEETMRDLIFPYLSQFRTDSMIHAHDGTPLFCSVFHADHPVGTVLLLHGFTENTYKYSEMIFSLLRNHFCVIAYDQRGHGRSGRDKDLSSNSVTHVDHFSDYVDDLSLICTSLLISMPKPWNLFAHSMGGAVAALYIEKYPDTFSAVSLCAPMIAPNTKVTPSFAAALFCYFPCILGRGKHYPFFMKPYSGPEDFVSSCATDPVRFAWYDKEKAAHPEFQNSIPTYRWTLESIHVTKKILASGAPEKITCPVLLSMAEHDFSVMPEEQKIFIKRVPDGKLIFVKDARHEIYRSMNHVLFPWWHENLSFFCRK